jgi:hypothetical protein
MLAWGTARPPRLGGEELVVFLVREDARVVQGATSPALCDLLRQSAESNLNFRSARTRTARGRTARTLGTGHRNLTTLLLRVRVAHHLVNRGICATRTMASIARFTGWGKG